MTEKLLILRRVLITLSLANLVLFSLNITSKNTGLATMNIVALMLSLYAINSINNKQKECQEVLNDRD